MYQFRRSSGRAAPHVRTARARVHDEGLLLLRSRRRRSGSVLPATLRGVPPHLPALRDRHAGGGGLGGGDGRLGLGRVHGAELRRRGPHRLLRQLRLRRQRGEGDVGAARIRGRRRPRRARALRHARRAHDRRPGALRRRRTRRAPDQDARLRARRQDHAGAAARRPLLSGAEAARAPAPELRAATRRRSGRARRRPGSLGAVAYATTRSSPTAGSRDPRPLDRRHQTTSPARRGRGTRHRGDALLDLREVGARPCPMATRRSRSSRDRGGTSSSWARATAGFGAQLQDDRARRARS